MPSRRFKINKFMLKIPTIRWFVDSHFVRSFVRSLFAYHFMCSNTRTHSHKIFIPHIWVDVCRTESTCGVAQSTQNWETTKHVFTVYFVCSYSATYCLVNWTTTPVCKLNTTKFTLYVYICSAYCAQFSYTSASVFVNFSLNLHTHSNAHMVAYYIVACIYRNFCADNRWQTDLFYI